MIQNNDDDMQDIPLPDDTDNTEQAEESLPQETAADLPEALMTPDGNFSSEWYRRFDELAPYADTLSKFRRPEALAKSYANLERLKGYPGIDDAPRMAAFRAAVGLPDSAEQFSIPRPDDTPDELWNPTLVNSLAQVAYEYGVPPKAMEALTARYAQEGRHFIKEMQLQQQESMQQADAQLQELWGPRYESNMHTVAAFLHTMGERAGVDTEALLHNPALRAEPAFAQLMLEAASLLQEAPMRSGMPSDGRREAHRIAHDPAHPLHEAYMRTSHPQHRYANEQYDRLAFGRQL
ncbi:MAG: hypothetical protein IJE66_07760 [Akkermansia sp.]|nr:hypothetical protein [Akkermansia sp.]